MKASSALVLAVLFASSTAAAQASWDARAAAAYLDARQTWWSGWQTAARDHQTACVSCHTALPFALARPALRGVLHESEPSAAERRMLDDVIKRVSLWKDVDPFYPDQTRGLPKTSESRGTESVLNHGQLVGVVAQQTARPEDRHRQVHERCGDRLRGACPHERGKALRTALPQRRRGRGGKTKAL